MPGFRACTTTHSDVQDEEGFLHFVAAAPQERGEKQELAATSVGMTAFVGRRALTQTPKPDPQLTLRLLPGTAGTS
jgi:hypothetical protein